MWHIFRWYHLFLRMILSINRGEFHLYGTGCVWGWYGGIRNPRRKDSLSCSVMWPAGGHLCKQERQGNITVNTNSAFLVWSKVRKYFATLLCMGGRRRRPPWIRLPPLGWPRSSSRRYTVEYGYLHHFRHTKSVRRTLVVVVYSLNRIRPWDFDAYLRLMQISAFHCTNYYYYY